MWSCVWLFVGVGGEFLSHHHPLRTFRHSDLVNGLVLCIIITRHSHGLPAMNHHIASLNKTLREQILREMYNWNIGMVHWDRPTPSPCKFPVIKWKVSWTTWHFVTRARTFSVPLYVWPEPMRGVETQAHWALWCPGDRDYFLDRGRAGHSPAVWTAQNLCRGHARRLRDHQII